METADETPESISEALALLEEHRADSVEPDPPVTAGRLPHGVLHVLPAAFQPRALGGEVVSAEHVGELRRALKRRGERGLDPIIVFWSGKRWFVIDGHHRLAAYRNSEDWADRAVAVERFSGDPDKAIAEATERNMKTVLPMLKGEKSEAGWRLVCLTNLRVTDIVAQADLSKSQVKKMRSRLRDVLDRFPGRFTKQGLADYPWRDVLKPTFGGPKEDREIDEDWVEALAHDFRDRLRKQFGDKLTKNPDAFAMAIRMLHNGLPSMLMDSIEWEEARNAKLDGWVTERTDVYDF